MFVSQFRVLNIVIGVRQRRSRPGSESRQSRAVGTSHGLGGLRPGARHVTVRRPRGPAAQSAGAGGDYRPARLRTVPPSDRPAGRRRRRSGSQGRRLRLPAQRGRPHGRHMPPPSETLRPPRVGDHVSGRRASGGGGTLRHSRASTERRPQVQVECRRTDDRCRGTAGRPAALIGSVCRTSERPGDTDQLNKTE